MEDAPAPQNSDRGTTAPLEENPSASPDVSMAVDAPSGLYQETPGPVQRIPFPGERRRSQASGSGTSSALGAEPSESRASQPANDMRAESDVGPSAGIISTKMGSLAPGCAVLRGESASAEGEGVAEENNPESEEEDGDEEEEATGREVEMGVGDLKAKQEMIDAVLPDVGTDDFDDDDLQLLYPDQPSPSAESSASRAGGRRSPAASSARDSRRCPRRRRVSRPCPLRRTSRPCPLRRSRSPRPPCSALGHTPTKSRASISALSRASCSRAARWARRCARCARRWGCSARSSPHRCRRA
ncbi:hypothetical protein B0H17DRAFT_77821 [Mycena rosella]|uniref:Uncharacterized protein n=1 Tax=Mycena rosella TaxID=1033263 RepID=A0AAD7GCY3_MYCRO|nr:hypothetical protein B0H17DRAFT_77821 [Mycena rosella]